MKELIQETDAYEILKPHLGTFRHIMVESLNQLNNVFNAVDVRLNNRAKSSTLHSIAVEKTKRLLADIPEIFILEKYQSIQIVFDKRLVARIKKINQKDLSTNSPTWRNNMIESQQLKLFQLPEITFIDLGYNIDPSWTVFEKLIVVCRVNEDVKWRIPFGEENIDITIKTIKSEPIEIVPKETLIKRKTTNGKN